MFKNFNGYIDSVYYEDLDIYDDDDFSYVDDDDKHRKIGSITTLFKNFERDYYKPIITDRGFAGEVNNYIEYMSEADKF